MLQHLLKHLYLKLRQYCILEILKGNSLLSVHSIDQSEKLIFLAVASASRLEMAMAFAVITAGKGVE